MKRVQSGQGATDFGALQPDPKLQRELATIVVNDQLGITGVVQEIDNLRAAVAEIRGLVSPTYSPSVIPRETIANVLERHELL